MIRNPKPWVIVRCYSQPWKYIQLVTDMEQVLLTAQTFYCISIGTIKLSILFFYDRIFGILKPMFRSVALVTGGFVIAYIVAGILGILLQCVPLRVLWEPPNDDPPGCIRVSTLITTLGVVNIVTDIIILSLPLPLVWRLQLSKVRRWQLVVAFSLGGL